MARQPLVSTPMNCPLIPTKQTKHDVFREVPRQEDSLAASLAGKEVDVVVIPPSPRAITGQPKRAFAQRLGHKSRKERQLNCLGTKCECVRGRGEMP